VKVKILTGSKILKNRVDVLNGLSKRHYLLTGLGAGIGDNNTRYHRYSLYLTRNNGYKALVFNGLNAKQSHIVIESFIDFFLVDKEDRPLLYAF